MKLVFAFLGILLSQITTAQVVSGLYSGTLVNDSTKKEQRYELALSEYRGKITGYSYTTFVRNDSLFYSVKRVKATRKGNELVVEDDKMIANNFPESPAKGVHQTNYIQLNNEDTLRTAKGTWQTNKTKNYYSIGGGVAMQLNNDSSRSALIGHLQELNIISQPHYQNDVAVVTTAKVKVKDDKIKIKTESKQSSQDSKTKEDKNKSVQDVTETKPSLIPYTNRKNKLFQSIDVTSDSLQLAFYDNGVIDGDSISVYVNGENIISNNKLLATATRKTIKLPATETIEIILVAENLGTIPPNTGLLVIKDGDQTYQVHFSADLQTNAAIIFKRKLK